MEKGSIVVYKNAISFSFEIDNRFSVICSSRFLFLFKSSWQRMFMQNDLIRKIQIEFLKASELGHCSTVRNTSKKIPKDVIDYSVIMLDLREEKQKYDW